MIAIWLQLGAPPEMSVRPAPQVARLGKPTVIEPDFPSATSSTRQAESEGAATDAWIAGSLEGATLGSLHPPSAPHTAIWSRIAVMVHLSGKLPSGRRMGDPPGYFGLFRRAGPLVGARARADELGRHLHGRRRASRVQSRPQPGRVSPYDM